LSQVEALGYAASRAFSSERAAWPAQGTGWSRHRDGHDLVAAHRRKDPILRSRGCREDVETDQMRVAVERARQLDDFGSPSRAGVAAMRAAHVYSPHPWRAAGRLCSEGPREVRAQVGEGSHLLTSAERPCCACASERSVTIVVCSCKLREAARERSPGLEKTVPAAGIHPI
jgi:hypothetical protein